MNLKDIKGIVDLMKKNAVSEFEMEEGDFKIKLKRDSGKPSMGLPMTEVAPMVLPEMLPASAPPVMTVPSPSAVSAPAVMPDGLEIKSPMIGTFYRKPSPDADSYVEVGSVVEPDTVVCIVEAMKVMNEIKAEIKGTIAEVLMEDGKPVEYGQALFRVEPK
jgi:acetyl-CoA carboxylase biotin carboxyl carrier protein